MGKMLAVRVEEAVIRAVEAVRDPKLYPTQSDFVREAIRRMVRAERQRRVAVEIDRLMHDPAEVALAQQIAEANARELAEHLAQLEQATGQ